ncbi:hypothetical protein [Roseateles aquatilis]|nr:hypothetical protein [Roseateles aquatilis]
MNSKILLGSSALALVLFCVAFYSVGGDEAPIPASGSGSETSGAATPAASRPSSVEAIATRTEPEVAASDRGTDIKWARALRNTRRDSLQLTAQRAALTGKLSDLVALRVVERRCFDFQFGVEVFPQRGVTLTPKQLEHFASRAPDCLRAGTPTSSSIALKDREGMGDAADDLLLSAGSTFMKNDPRREIVSAALLEAGSIELLDAASTSNFTILDAYRAGLSKGEWPLIDEQLMDIAIKVQACTARGDCDLVAMDRMECALWRSCVSNLADLPSQKVFVPAEHRIWPFHDPSLSIETLQARWAAIQSFVASRFRP